MAKKKYNNAEETVMKVTEIILDSKLSYWESLGILDHAKMEIHKLTDEPIENECK